MNSLQSIEDEKILKNKNSLSYMSLGVFLKKLKMNDKLKEIEENLEAAYIQEIWKYLKKCENERYYIGYDMFALDNKDVPAVKIENGELYFYIDCFRELLTSADLFFENDELDKYNCTWYTLNKCIDYIDEFGIDRLIFLKAVYNAMDINHLDDDNSEETHSIFNGEKENKSINSKDYDIIL